MEQDPRWDDHDDYEDDITPASGEEIDEYKSDPADDYETDEVEQDATEE